MRAVADEFLPLPATPNALLKVCLKVSETRRCSQPAQNPRGEVWVAYSGKGGVGVTTPVANLAFSLRTPAPPPPRAAAPPRRVPAARLRVPAGHDEPSRLRPRAARRARGRHRPAAARAL